MRRFLALFLSIILVFSNVASADSSMVFDSMSLEELLEIRRLVDTEIRTRTDSSPSVFPAGLYIGGKSIKPGAYTISANDEYYGISIAMFSNTEKYEKYFADGEINDSLMSFEGNLNRGDSAFVYIEEGTVLLINDTALIESTVATWLP